MPAEWYAATTTQAERKQLLRCLVKDVTLTKRATTLYVAIRWQTEACTTLEIPRPKRSCDLRRTDAAVVDRIRELATSHTDRQIADILNEEGLIPGLGGTFTKAKVVWIRYTYGVALDCPAAPRVGAMEQRGDGRYSARAAAELLNVNVSTIADWCSAGRLDHIQETPHGPRWIQLMPEDILALRKPVRQRKPRHSLT